MNFRELVSKEIMLLRDESFDYPTPIVAFGITPDKYHVLLMEAISTFKNLDSKQGGSRYTRRRFELVDLNIRDLYETRREFSRIICEEEERENYSGWPSEGYSDLWTIHEFENELLRAPYIFVHDLYYPEKGPIPSQFQLSVLQDLLKHITWGIICYEPNRDYWSKRVSPEFNKFIDENFRILDFAKTITPIENRLKEALDKCGIAYKFQYPIQGNSKLYRLDFYFEINGIRLNVECDGEAYHSTPEAIFKDRMRNAAMKSQGIEYMRFTGSEIWKTIDRCVDEIKGKLRIRVR